MALSDSLQFFPCTDVGRVRDLNEDNFLVDKKLGLSIVADGMGGHAAGEVASALAVRLIHQELRRREDLILAYAQGKASRDAAREIQQLMELAVLRACSRIHEEAKSDAAKRGMGTTVSALLIAGSHGFVAHVGDSRVYLYREGRIQQVTEDHNVYNELIRRGRLTPEQIEKVAQKNAVTRAVGVYERVDVDTLMLELLSADQFLLCSDGLHGYINHNAELEPFFEDEDGDKSVNEMIDLANRKGGKDNITSVLVRVARSQEKDAARARRLMQKRQALAGMPLFAKLQDRELLRIMQVADVLEFEPGQDVVREGDRGDELFIVIDGVLQILRGEQVLSEVGPGEHFGEMALIRSSPRSATVRAVERADVIAIKRSDFFAILRKEYELAVKLLWQFLGVLADRLDQTSRDLSSAKEELAAEDISDVIALAEDLAEAEDLEETGETEETRETEDEDTSADLSSSEDTSGEDAEETSAGSHPAASASELELAATQAVPHASQSKPPSFASASVPPPRVALPATTNVGETLPSGEDAKDLRTQVRGALGTIPLIETPDTDAVDLGTPSGEG